VSGRREQSDRRPLAAAGSAEDVRWVPLGYIAGTHGLRGDLRVKQHNPDSELLFELDEVALRHDGVVHVHEVSGVRGAGKGLLLHLVGVDSIEAAERLRGAEVCIPRAALPPLAPGEFYHVDLEGLAARRVDGSQVGVVERVCDYPASQVVRIQGPEGVWEVPMIAPYLVSVDVQAGEIVVDRLEDLELERNA
jgi:16S rRNA processing protein RimM